MEGKTVLSGSVPATHVNAAGTIIENKSTTAVFHPLLLYMFFPKSDIKKMQKDALKAMAKYGVVDGVRNKASFTTR